jgi:acyl-CoA reductase-like NAD-dependent aldehyde dehydrogenase
MLSGHSQSSGQTLAEHMEVCALSFTGSTRTGRPIQIASGNFNFKEVVFELGGKSPALTFDDANIKQAAKEIENNIDWNSSQTCMAKSRIYVQHVKCRRFGDPLAKETTHGPPARNSTKVDRDWQTTSHIHNRHARRTQRRKRVLKIPPHAPHQESDGVLGFAVRRVEGEWDGEREFVGEYGTSF